MAPQPLNIIYFNTHDMGRWIQPYGAPVSTPHFQAFADKSMMFRKAFSVAPTCSPSRAGLLTGSTPHEVNMLGLAHRGFGPVTEEKHLSNFLRDQGYATALAGGQHEAAAPATGLGYEARIGNEPDVADAACEWLRERGGDDRPFLLTVGTFMPHRKFPPPLEGENIDRITPPFPVSDTPAGRLDFARYKAAVAQADASFGKILAAMDELDLWSKTIILMTTDHGPAFPNMKCTLHDTGLGVAMMLYYPGITHPGGVSDSMVSHLDVFPTLCELCNLPKPEWLQGNPLQPILIDPTASIRSELFGEVTYHAAYQPMRCIRTERYKWIRHFDPERLLPVLANVDDGEERQRLLAADWHLIAHPDTELYDLACDPFETHNRTGDPALADVQSDLDARLMRWMQKTNDPLLIHSPRVPIPKGARVNPLHLTGHEHEEWEESP